MEVCAPAACSLRLVSPANHSRWSSDATGSPPSFPMSRKSLEGSRSVAGRRWPLFHHSRRRSRPLLSSGNSNSRAEDPEMSVESALKLLGVAEGASFDEILRAKKSIVALCKDDQKLVSQVEAAYDMLLMESLTQRRAGRVDSSIRYADVKTASRKGTGGLPEWLKRVPISVEAPTATNTRIQTGVYGALMACAFISGSYSSTGEPYAGADAPGFILATGFGASLIFLAKKDVNLGKAAALTLGGLAVGAAVGSVAESWLQVEIVPFLGIHSPAAFVSEFILFSQYLVSLYLS